MDLHIVCTKDYCNILLVEKSCSLPKRQPANGSISFDKKDKSAHFKCERGYIMKGEGTIRCKNGRWSSWLPRCSKTNSITS